jgi:hypothetical protein
MSVQRRYKEIYTSYTNSAKIDANDAVDRYAKTLAVWCGADQIDRRWLVEDRPT